MTEPAALPPEPFAPTERKVLVGRIYTSINTTWNEHPDTTFDAAVQRIAEKAKDSKASGHPDEVIEVIVVRRARVRAEVSVEVVDSEPAPNGDIGGDRG